MLNWFRKTFRTARLARSSENYPSVVVLLKEPVIRTSDDSLDLVTRALGADADVQLISVLNNGNSHLIRHGKFFFTFHQADRRYELPGYKPTGVVRTAWNEHTAWIAFDLPAQSSAKLRELKHFRERYRQTIKGSRGLSIKERPLCAELSGPQYSLKCFSCGGSRGCSDSSLRARLEF
jgi:hypothetical protein